MRLASPAAVPLARLERTQSMQYVPSLWTGSLSRAVTPAFAPFGRGRSLHPALVVMLSAGVVLVPVTGLTASNDSSRSVGDVALYCATTLFESSAKASAPTPAYSVPPGGGV